MYERLFGMYISPWSGSLWCNNETFDEVVADNLSDKEAHDLVLKLRNEESDDRFTYIQSTKDSLKEGVTFEVNDDGDLVAKSKDNFLIISEY